MKILIIGPSNIGDAILMSAVIPWLRRRYPGAHLTLVLGERALSFFEDDPRVQRLINADLFDSAIGRLRLACLLFQDHPDGVVDVRHTLYPLLLKPLSAWRYLRRPPLQIRHMRERYLWIGCAQVPGLIAPRKDDRSFLEGAIEWSANDQAHVEYLWNRWQLASAHPLVVICPGTRSHIKRWGSSGFAQVADRLIAQQGAQVILSGEPSEGPIVQEILSLMSHRAYSSVGLTTIRQLGLFMRRAGVVITNDSAALHLASALQVPTVAIFGPTDETKYGPMAPRYRIIRRRLFCSPCEQALCRFNHECMRFISPDEVYRAAVDLLGFVKK